MLAHKSPMSYEEFENQMVAYSRCNLPNGIVFNKPMTEDELLHMQILYDHYLQGYTIETIMEVYYDGDPFQTFFM